MSLTITHRGSAQSNGSAAGISVTTYAATPAGDILFFILGKDDDTATTTRPSGFTVLKEGILASGGIYCEVYYKIITATESSQTYTWVGDTKSYTVVAFSLHSDLGDLESAPTVYGLSEGNSTDALCPDPGDNKLGILINGFVCDQDESPFTADYRATKLRELIETGAGGHCNGIYYSIFPSGLSYIKTLDSPVFDTTNESNQRNFGYSTGISNDGLEMVGLTRSDSSISSFTRTSKSAAWTYRNKLSLPQTARYFLHMDGSGKNLVVSWDNSGYYCASYYRSTLSSTWTLQEALGPFSLLRIHLLTEDGLCLVVGFNTGTYAGWRTYTRATLTSTWTQEGSDYTPSENIADVDGLKGLSRDGLVAVSRDYAYKRSSRTSAWTYVGENNVDINIGDMDETGLKILHRLNDTFYVYFSERPSIDSTTWVTTALKIRKTSGIQVPPSIPKDFKDFIIGYIYADGNGFTNNGAVYSYEIFDTSYQAEHTLSGANDWLTYSIWVGDLTVYSHDPSGGAVVSGEALFNRVRGITGSGGAIVTGTPAISTNKDYISSGGVITGGITDTAYVPGANNVFEHFPSGGVVLSGSPKINVFWDYLPSGSVSVSGTAPINLSWDYLQSGEVVVSGETLTAPPVPYAVLVTPTTKGTITFRYDGSFTYTYTDTPPGGYPPPAEFPNAIDEDSFTYKVVDEVGESLPQTNPIYINSTIKTYPVVGSGGVFVSGAAIVPRYYEEFPAGGVIVSGEALIPRLWRVYPSGGVIVGGVAPPALAPVITIYEVVITGAADGKEDYSYILKSFSGIFYSGLRSSLNFQLIRQAGDIQAVIDRPNGEIILYRNKKEVVRGVPESFSHYTGPTSKTFTIKAIYTTTELTPKVLTHPVENINYDFSGKRTFQLPGFIDFQPLDSLYFEGQSIEIDFVLPYISPEITYFRVKEK